MSISIFIADDHAIVREGIKTVLSKTSQDIHVVGEASNGRDVLEAAKSGVRQIDIYVLDISMPLLNGLEVADRLMKISNKSQVIILSMHDDRMSVEKALECGVKGYLIKESAPEEIVQAVREVYARRFFISSKICHYLVRGFLGQPSRNTGKSSVVALTPKEKEVLQLIAEGFTGKEVAVKLRISAGTEHVHRKNIMQKLNIHKQTELVRFALKEGLATL